jgi:type I restriction-modification system DNA methylase subunit
MAKGNDRGAHLGFENDLWRAADALRSNLDAAEYHTPRSVIRALVDMLAPYHGRVFDPCCDSWNRTVAVSA